MTDSITDRVLESRNVTFNNIKNEGGNLKQLLRHLAAEREAILSLEFKNLGIDADVQTSLLRLLEIQGTLDEKLRCYLELVNQYESKTGIVIHRLKIEADNYMRTYKGLYTDWNACV